MTRTPRTRIILASLLAAALLAAAWTLTPLTRVAAQDDTETVADGPLLEDERNTVEIFERYGASVVAVNVTVEGRVTNPLEDVPEEQIPPMFRQFLPQFEQRQPPRRGSGSGFVVDADGSIVTNYHVIQAALEEDSVTMLDEADMTISFQDGSTVPVRVVGANALYDLALLALEDTEDLPSDLNPIPLGEELPRVGQKTIAIGNPFWFESTVTTGIVSAIGRTLPGVGEVSVSLVQTDAAINPGNSGGPLLDSAGRLIGVNTAIFSPSGASAGIGFAVPVSAVRRVVPRLIETGGYRPPTAGIDVDARVNAAVNRQGL